jgi:hypothetical protein
LAVYFFSIFNYFTLSSLYVLLNIKTPDFVFEYMSLVFKSCQSTILSLVGVSIPIQPLSSERVDDPRAQYFGISSDLLSSNLVGGAIVLCNIMLYEMAVLIFGKKCLGKRRIYHFLKTERMAIYWGFIVSNMVPLIISWKYSFFGEVTSFTSTINLVTQYILLLILAFLIFASFLLNFKDNEGKKHRIKETLREWWSGY